MINLLHPYPVDVTAQMLDCFSEKYDLPEKKVTDVDEFEGKLGRRQLDDGVGELAVE